MYRFCAGIILLSLCVFGSAHAQRPTERGLPFVQNFKPQDYAGYTQNWEVVQDNRGVIYVSNSLGILEYDGVSWRDIPSPRRSLVRAVTVGPDGLIYTGTWTDPAFLEADEYGELHFYSLRSKLSADDKEPLAISTTKTIGEDVWFVAPSRLLRWDGQAMHSIPALSRFSFGPYTRNNSVFIFDNEEGLLRVKNDSLIHLPGSKAPDGTLVVEIVPMSGSNFIYITRHNGLYQYDGERIRSFSTTAESYLKTQLPYKGKLLNDGRLAIATDNRGVIVLPTGGGNPQIVDRASGLQNNGVQNLFQDRQDGLWLPLTVGISRVDLTSSLSFFGDAHGTVGNINNFERHKGTLFISTLAGLQRLVASTESYNWRLENVPGMSGDTRSMLSVGSSLLVANENGIYEYENGRFRLIRKGFTSVLLQSAKNPDIVFAGMEENLVILRKDKKTSLWRYDRTILNDVQQEIYDLVELSDGSLSIGFLTADVALARPRVDSELDYDITYLGSEQGLPDRSLGPVFNSKNGLFWEENPIFWTIESGRAKMDSSDYPAILRNLKKVTAASADDSGRIWLTGEDDRGALLRYPNTHDRGATITEIRLPGDFINILSLEETESGVVAWMGTPSRIFKFLESDVVPNDYSFPTLVRQIEYADSTYFWEAPNRQITFPWKSGDEASLRIHYAAPVYGSTAHTQYRYQLDGFSEDWSLWTTETMKTYSNLFEGSYTFRVEARTEAGTNRSAGVFRFQISPPLYRTWWAYLGWALMALGLLASTVRWRTRRLEERTLILEREVSERTDQLREQTVRLRQQADELAELDRTKSRFFANISHEFRTPLTLISGSLDDVMSGSFGSELISLKPHLERARRSGRRLLRLVSQLLDLSRLEAGQQTSFLKAGDLARSLRQVAAMFDSFAESRDIIFVRSGISERFDHVFDAEKIEKVAINLLSNAFKFTPRNGQISISLSRMDDGSACLDVEDTGLGISPEHLESIFDRFYMIDDSMTRSREGTGIGLALVREFVELHEGRVSVESQLGEGTRFSVVLPRLPEPEGVSTDVLDDLSTEVVRLAQAETDSRAVSETNVPIAGDESMIVLVVEDNEDMREYIRVNLQDTFEIILAPDGVQGLELARTAVPDLVLSDVMMPEMDGMELCNTLKNDVRTSHIPVILLTAKADIESRLAGLQTGADAYLPKPFNSQELNVRIQALIEHRKRMQAHYAAPSGSEEESGEHLPAREAEFVERLRTLIEERMPRSSFGVDELADEMALSRRQLLRKMKAVLGEGPNEMIRRLRLEKAAIMLRDDGVSVKEAAASVGFESTSYFSRVFAQAYGKSPSAFARQSPNE